MPQLLVDVLAAAALVALLAVAFAGALARVELLVGAVVVGLVLAVGAVDVPAALDTVRLLLPVVAFLTGILVVAELCAVEGVFQAVGTRVARASRGAPRRLLALTFVAAALTTAVLSLDATVVLLTPVVATAATAVRVSPRPGVLACVRLANSASLLLPVSNLTNLLALPAVPSMSFVGFGVLMAPVWLAVITVEYAGHRLYFARDLVAGARVDAPRGQTSDVALPVVPLATVGVMLVGFAVLSPLGVEPAWVAWAAALVLGARAVVRRRVGAVLLMRAANLPFAGYVLCLGVVVTALSRAFLGDLVRELLPTGTGLWALLGVALLATLLANLVNNLPATLLLVPLVAPGGTVVVLAALIGLGVGSGLTYPGSLANLLWRRTLTPESAAGGPGRDFHLLSLLVTLPAVVVGVLVLWAWAPLAG